MSSARAGMKSKLLESDSHTRFAASKELRVEAQQMQLASQQARMHIDLGKVSADTIMMMYQPSAIHSQIERTTTSTLELLIQIFEHLSLRDLILASHVDSQWRALAPKIDSPIRRRLALAFTTVAERLHPISLSIRICYVDTVETKYYVLGTTVSKLKAFRSGIMWNGIQPLRRLTGTR
ncbi:hypothetical protein DFH06DRAFT_1121264 [Mycena polygramma]|nr:hypothetical protein DFH06DRAFT_1121264 [Mycena polygramma]